MIDYFDLNSLFEQGVELYNQNKYSKARSYFIQARNQAIQFEKVGALTLDLKPFRERCNCFIGKCFKGLEEKFK